MFQFISVVNDEQVGGLESLFNYMNENSFSKDDPAINNIVITLLETIQRRDA